MKDENKGKDPNDHGNDTVSITVNNKPYPIHRGRQTIEAIKNAGGVALADKVDQIIEGKLVPLDDNGSVVIKGGEEFKSHPPSGGAS